MEQPSTDEISALHDKELSRLIKSRLIKKSFKYCVVPKCKNTVIKARSKHFFVFPIKTEERNRWCAAINKDIDTTKIRYVCEDHFNLQTDTENYSESKKKNLMLELKPDVVPHIFKCTKESISVHNKIQENMLDSNHHYQFNTDKTHQDNNHDENLDMYNNICRVCGHYSTMNHELSYVWHSVLSDDFVTISEDLHALTGVLAVCGDGGPPSVCAECCGRMRTAGGLVADMRRSGGGGGHWPRPIQVEKMPLENIQIEIKTEPLWEETECGDDFHISNCDIKLEPEEIHHPDGYFDVPLSPQIELTNNKQTELTSSPYKLTCVPTHKLTKDSPRNKLTSPPNNLTNSPTTKTRNPENKICNPENKICNPENKTHNPESKETSPENKKSPESLTKNLHTGVNGISQGTPPSSHLVETFSQHIEMFDEKIQKVYIPSEVENSRKHTKIIDVSDVTCKKRVKEEDFSEVEYLECYKCEREFADLQDISKQCVLCLRNYRTISGLRAHVMCTHTYNTRKNTCKQTHRHRCNFCRRTFSTQTDLLVHSSCHSQLCCYICGDIFNTFKELHAHRNQCTKRDTRTNRSKDKTRNDSKVLTPPPKRRKLKTPPHIKYQPNTPDTPANLYNCPLCSAEFSDSYYVKIHIEANHQDKVKDVIQSGEFVTCSEQLSNGVQCSKESLENMLEG